MHQPCAVLIFGGSRGFAPQPGPDGELRDSDGLAVRHQPAADPDGEERERGDALEA